MRRKFTSLSCFLLLMLASVSVSAQNTALSFNGTDNYVTTTAYVVPSTGDFTVEFWAYVPTMLSNLHEFVSQGTGTTNGFYIGYNGASGGDLRAGDAWQSTGVACPIGQWFHLALVNSSGTATLYINGVQRAQKASGYSIAANATFFRMGNQFDPFTTELLNGYLDEVRVWNLARTGSEVKQGMYGTVSTSAPGLVAYYNMNDGAGTTVTNSTATAGLDGTVVGTSPVWPSSPIQFGNNALNFDGVDDHVQAPGDASYDITSGTVEALINPTTLNATNMTIVGLRTDGLTATRFSFHVSSTQIGMWNGTAFSVIPATIPTGTWTHLAFVCDGTNTLVYINGTPSGTITQAFGTAALTTLAIGTGKNSGGDAEFFNGGIDEVRLWNTQRSQAEINANMNGTLPGTSAGLVAQFAFDQGVPSGDNSNLITAIDNTALTNNANMLGFALSGATSNFILSPLNTILPVSFLSFNATAKDGQAYLQWQTGQEENSKEFLVERSTDGINFITIGSVAAAGTSHTTQTYSYTDANPAPGTNYYRIKEKDLDSKLTYSSIRSLNFAQTGPSKVAWSSLVSGQAEVTLLPGSSEFYQVLNTSGTRVQQGRLSAGKFYLSGVASGIYIVNITTQSGSQINTRIMVK